MRQTFARRRNTYPPGVGALLSVPMASRGSCSSLRSWRNGTIRKSTDGVRLSGLSNWLLVERLTAWLPDLTYPVRSGTHSQTAFALGMALDWARVTGDQDVESLIEQRAVTLYANDSDCPIHYEPSGADFLSPCLAEADLMRRVYSVDRFAIG